MVPQKKPKTAICAEQQRLSRAFLDAVQQVTELQSRNVDALTTAGAGMERFELAIRQARKRRDEAKRAYARHLREHGCFNQLTGS
ncbi:MAG TPA: hypothetical protein VKT49_13030 [Bryobacteraceae bacterium]|nr:hypothetical protein [Bryobacteraceae bacterium]